jgi:uncharacterized protein YjbI with pentapeptide repeats
MPLHLIGRGTTRAKKAWLGPTMVAALTIVTPLFIIVSVYAGFAWSSPQLQFTALLLIGLYIIWLFWAGYRAKWTGFGDYTNPVPGGNLVRGKTLWDWLELFIIPAALFLAGYMLNSAQQEQESNNAKANAQEAALQIYLSQMANLLVDKDLSTDPKSQTKHVARVWTITVVRQVNADHKRIVLEFLSESVLIQGQNPVVNLATADFSGANLSGVNLSGTNLSSANFTKADLTGANLTGANLQGADLRGANLKKAHVGQARLNGANLAGANLAEADLNQMQCVGSQYTQDTVWPDNYDPVQQCAMLIN